jgi:ankyrin repeat protein
MSLQRTFSKPHNHEDYNKNAAAARERSEIPHGYNVLVPPEIVLIDIHALACRGGQFKKELAEELDIRPTRIDEKCKATRATLLILAAKNRRLKTCRMLIEMGADIYLSDRDGRTALHFSFMQGYIDIIKILIESGADINVEDEHGWRPIHEAVQLNRIDLVQMLLDEGAKIDGQTSAGSTILHISCMHGFTDLTRILISEGADLHTIDKVGKSPLDYMRDTVSITAPEYNSRGTYYDPTPKK